MSGAGDTSGWLAPSRPKGDSGGPDPCDLFEATQLSSPVPSVVTKLSEGSILNVTVKGTAQLLVLFNGQVAGSITSPKMMLFISCILGNQETYEARVLSVHGGQVKIKVYRV